MNSTSAWMFRLWALKSGKITFGKLESFILGRLSFHRDEMKTRVLGFLSIENDLNRNVLLVIDTFPIELEADPQRDTSYRCIRLSAISLFQIDQFCVWLVVDLYVQIHHWPAFKIHRTCTDRIIRKKTQTNTPKMRSFYSKSPYDNRSNRKLKLIV